MPRIIPQMRREEVSGHFVPPLLGLAARTAAEQLRLEFLRFHSVTESGLPSQNLPLH